MCDVATPEHFGSRILIVKAPETAGVAFVGLLAADVTDTVASEDASVPALDVDSYLPIAVHADSGACRMTNAMATREIVAQLVEAAGVDAKALDASRLQWVLEARCRDLKLEGVVEYVEYLRGTPDEIEELIDAIVVPETRFFRDAAVFEHLQMALKAIADEIHEPLRVLSAPCSTGQEAYSVAAAMMEAGLVPARFTVTAMDLSTKALETARRGVYPENAMRHVSAEHRRALGRLEGSHWKMHDVLRKRIRFERKNLAEPDALGDETYHVILCRNLFIYLSPAARAALATSLASGLAPGGRLVLGSADRVAEVSAVFAPLKPAAAFAFARREAEVPAVSTEVAEELVAHKPRVSVAVVAAAADVAMDVEATSAAGLLARALLHQQHGDLRRAEYRCRQALYLDAGCLPALELLETLWKAQPNERFAESSFRTHRA